MSTPIRGGVVTENGIRVFNMDFVEIDSSTGHIFDRSLMKWYYMKLNQSVLKLWKKKWQNAGSEAPKAPRRTPKAWESRRRRRRGGGEWGADAPSHTDYEGLGASSVPPRGPAPSRPKTNLVYFVAAIKTLIATIYLICFIKHCSCSLSLLFRTLQKYNNVITANRLIIGCL